MSLSRAHFVERLTASGIFSAADVAEFERKVAAARETSDAQVYARLLVQHSRLTKYQAAALYQGKTKGLVLGNYVLLDKLGAGGMGQVFKALHRRMERVVALKVLPAEATKSPENVKRFHREVKAAARLEHPNIVAAHDADEADGTHFLVMQYVEGKDLSALVKEHGPFAVTQAVECIRQAALGLAYAHKRGVIHRDIKPANLLLDSEGTVKILDMGLARLEGQLHDAASVAGLTQSGQVMGTVDYMSPEQAEETRGVDARADQYSLGCTLWVLLTGRPMFGGTTTIAKLMAHRTAPIPSLRAARADVPEALEAVYQRMVAKEPAARYNSMDEVIAALATCLGDAPLSSLDGPSSSSTRLTEFFQQIAGVATAAPPKSVTALDEETEQLQPAKQETGTEYKAAASPRGAETRPIAPQGKPSPAAIAAPPPEAAPLAALTQPDTKAVSPAPSTKSKRNIHALALAAGLAITGIGSMGLLLVAMLWLVKPNAEPAPEAEPATVIAATDADDIAPPHLAVAPFDRAAAEKHQQAWADFLNLPVEKEITLPGGAKLTMMLIPPGEFLMGSTDEERAKFLAEAQGSSERWIMDWIPSEGPQHRVHITKPFYLGKHEVTQAQWASLMGSNPSAFQGDSSLPVEEVSWSDIQPVLAKLNADSAAAGLKFGLPTEAQWEYACRAGTTTTWHCGESAETVRQYGWFNANAEGKTRPVGQLQANSFGLHDMHGNVWEHCADWQAFDYYARSPADDPPGAAPGTHHAVRGGSWFDGVTICRSANHFHGTPEAHGHNHGFRLAASIEPVAPANRETTTHLLFDGDDYVEAKSVPLDPKQDLTIEAWVKSSEKHTGVVAAVSDPKTKAYRGIWFESGTPAGGAIDAPSFRYVHVPHDRDDEWMHLACVRTADGVRVYLNGKRSDGHLGQVEESHSFTGLLLGRAQQKEPFAFFKGALREVRVSSVARYLETFTPPKFADRFTSDEHTLALYHCDEGAGKVLRDSSGNNHDGKIVGAKWVKTQETPPTLSFGGCDRIDVPVPPLAGLDALCVEAWVRPRTIKPKDYAAIYFSEWQYELRLSPAGTYGFIASALGDWHWVDSSELAVAGQRAHVAGVMRSDGLHLFVDGKHVDHKSLADPRVNQSKGQAMIGRNWDGMIEQVRVSKASRYAANFAPPNRLERDGDTLALYRFDEGEGDVLLDTSGHGRHGKIVGAKWVQLSTPADKPPGPATYLRFDGKSNYVDVPTFKPKTTRDPLTIEAWARIAGRRTSQVVILPGSRGMNVGPVEEHWAAWRYADDHWETQAADAPPQAGRWYHIAGVWDGEKSTLFVDGRAQKGASASYPVAQTGEALTIGGSPMATNGNFDRFFDGDIGPVRISKSARYTSDFTPQLQFASDTDTLALYHCNEGAGEVLLDASNNGHHGILRGARWASDKPLPKTIDYALLFRHDDLVRCEGVEVNVSKPFTVECYFDLPWALNFAFPVHMDSPVQFVIFANDVFLQTHNGESAPIRSPVAKLENNRRYHIAWVGTGEDHLLFVDGKQVATQKLPAALENKGYTFTIGYRHSGAIDEVRISSVARYTKDFTPAARHAPDGDTLALYHFDDGSGDVLRDASSHARDGKITGAKWIPAPGGLKADSAERSSE